MSFLLFLFLKFFYFLVFFVVNLFTYAYIVWVISPPCPPPPPFLPAAPFLPQFQAGHSSTELEKRAEQVLPGTEGEGGTWWEWRAGGRNDLNNVCT
jgi:hypothetical protein